MAVMDEETGHLLNYRQLLCSAKYKKQWGISSANKFGRLAKWRWKQNQESHQHNPIHTQKRHPPGSQERRHIWILCVQRATRNPTPF